MEPCPLRVFSSEMFSDVNPEQGDQIRRFFAYWVIVCFRQFLENYKINKN
jgi:hypothetical protein